jgi:uncharacterized membrane protein
MVILVSNQPQIEKTDSAFFRQAFPADLAFVLVWLAVNFGVIYLPILNETIVKPLFVIPFILIIPGYCLIAALFPKKDDISLSERIALSIGLSIAVVPLIGFGLNFTPFGIRLDPILIALTVFILVMILVAYYRRSLLSLEERFGVSFFETAGTLWNMIFPKEGSWVNHLISVVIALAILATVILTVYIVAVPKEGELFTEFFILGENKTASNYPDLIITGQNYPMWIGVGNHEYRNMMYTIETWTVLTEFDNLTNSTTIMAMDPLDQFSLTLAHNETVILPYTLSLNKTGYNRVEFLLFNETVPGPEVTGSDRINRSSQDLHLWVINKDAAFQNNSIRAISITQL